jgi:hypothetical protein
MTPLLEHKLDWAVMGLCSSVAAILSQSQLAQTLDPEMVKQIACASFCGIGSVASGYLGSTVFPITKITFRQCWIANFICGFLLSPALVYYLLWKYPHLPLPFLSGATSFFLGAAGVTSLRFALPKFLNFYAKIFGQAEKSRSGNDENEQ